MKRASADELTLEVFSKSIDTPIRASAGVATPVELRLHAVSFNESSGAGANFAVVFTGPADQLLPQGTYTFEHDRIGVFDLFIVPIGKDSNGVRYEAVFNRSGR